MAWTIQDSKSQHLTRNIALTLNKFKIHTVYYNAYEEPKTTIRLPPGLITLTNQTTVSSYGFPPGTTMEGV
jgi:hypothetical protein